MAIIATTEGTVNLDAKQGTGQRENLSSVLSAFEKVTFFDVNRPTELGGHLQALFNPDSLEIGRDLTLGTLNPIGSSHPVFNYSHTLNNAFSIKLQFTAQAFAEFNIPFPDHMEVLGFFNSFHYGDAPGEAPSYMVVIWPNTLRMACIVQSMKFRVLQWNKELRVKNFDIDLDLIDVWDGHISREDAYQMPFYKLPRGITGSVNRFTIPTGKPLNFAK